MFGDNMFGGTRSGKWFYGNSQSKSENTWYSDTFTSSATRVSDGSDLSYDKLREVMESLESTQVHIKSSEEVAEDNINEVLKEKGLPEFDTILKHYLESFPEYDL